MKTSLLLLIFSIALLDSCQLKTKNTKMENNTFNKGSFGYDLQFLQKKDSLIVLSDGDAQVIVSAKYQGKVFTSTAEGLNGKSFGWLNYKALASDSLVAQINAYGGEDRLWLGPEGGQFSIFFKPGDPMEFKNWQTPAALDSEPWDLIDKDQNSVKLSKTMQLLNASGTPFNVALNRTVKLLNTHDLQNKFGLNIPSSIKWVGFETQNQLTNTGTNEWTRKSGTLCIWMLGMLNPSDSGVVVIPYIQGDEQTLGPIATTNYFGEIPKDRIKIEDGHLFFKIDGKHRSKLGLSKLRASAFAGSYDAIDNVLTIIHYKKPEGNPDYINQVWEEQKEPFVGDVINAYNDGPLEDGSQLGPFYELETSSPAAFLKPGKSISHTQSIYHFTGNTDDLNHISEKLLGVSIEQIKDTF